MVSQLDLCSSPNQTFKAAIPGDKQNLTFNISMSYNEESGYWIMGIYDSSLEPIVLNIPLLCGHDLLEQYQYLNIGSIFIVNVGDPTIETPNDTNIDTNFKMIWVLT
jgi:hypothetical protein